jgi:hypothetical protein
MTDGAPAAGDPDRSFRAAVDSLLGPGPSFGPVAVGWATVDLDRMEHDFSEAYPGSVGASIELPDDSLLGARCRRIEIGVTGVPTLVLLEPSTEGRLAATLARHGEGLAAIWLASPPPPGPATDAGPAPSATARSIVADGPFGPEVLLLDGPIHGPHRLVVLVEPGTITP